VLPYSQLVPFVREHGLDMRLFFDQLFATRISAFFALDVIVSAVVLWTFVFVEGRRRGVKRLWMPIAASLIVGVSLALPLFLYLREARAEN
jgi:predicted exporter